MPERLSANVQPVVGTLGIDDLARVVHGVTRPPAAEEPTVSEHDHLADDPSPAVLAFSIQAATRALRARRYVFSDTAARQKNRPRSVSTALTSSWIVRSRQVTGSAYAGPGLAKTTTGVVGYLAVSQPCGYFTTM